MSSFICLYKKGDLFQADTPLIQTWTFYDLFHINAIWLFNGPFSTSHDFLKRSKTVLKLLQTPILLCPIQNENEPSPPLEGSCDIEMGPLIKVAHNNLKHCLTLLNGKW